MHYPTPSGFITCPKRGFSVRISAITSFMPDPGNQYTSTLVWLSNGEDCQMEINVETLSDEINHYFKP